MVLATQQSKLQMARRISLRNMRSSKNPQKVSEKHLGSLGSVEQEEPLKVEEKILKSKKMSAA